MPGAVLAAVQPAVCGAGRRDCAGGNGCEGDLVLRDDSQRSQGAGPAVLLHEPEAELSGGVLGPGAEGDDVCRRVERVGGG